MDNKIQNLKRLHRTSKNKKNLRELMRKNYKSFTIFRMQLCSTLWTRRQMHKRFIKKHIWLIPLTQMLIVHWSAINMGKFERRLGSSEPACLNTHTSDDKMGKLSWILALFLVSLQHCSELKNYTGFLFVTRLWLVVRVKGKC